jgi:hypothetical protein
MGALLSVGGLMVPAAVTVLFFTAAVARKVLGGSRSAADGSPPGRSAGAVATEELHALLYAGKRAQLEQRRVELVLRDDEADGAPPRTGIDLAGGRAVIRAPHGS